MEVQSVQRLVFNGCRTLLPEPCDNARRLGSRPENSAAWGEAGSPSAAEFVPRSKIWRALALLSGAFRSVYHLFLANVSIRTTMSFTVRSPHSAGFASAITLS